MKLFYMYEHKNTICNFLILNLTRGLGLAVNYSRWQWPQGDHSLPYCHGTLGNHRCSKGGRNNSGTKSRAAWSECLNSPIWEDLQATEHVSLDFQSLYLSTHVRSPWQPESLPAFHHAWLHACLLCLTLKGLVSWRRVSSRLFILLLPWFCGKTKQVIELFVILNCFLICVWSSAWWDWHTRHKLAFTRLSPSINKHFLCIFI